MNLTQYAANALLDGDPMPTTLYCQLHVGNPGAAGTANVATETDRVALTLTAPSGGVASNAALLEWLLYPAEDDLTHVTLWDASSGGNPWWAGAITGAPITTVAGQAVEIPLGLLDLSFTTWA